MKPAHSLPSGVLRIAVGVVLLVPPTGSAQLFSVSTNGLGIRISLNKGLFQPSSRSSIPGGGSAAVTQCAFTIDPRWRDWSSNAVVLIDSAHHGRESGDFLQWQRSELKLLYAKVFAKYEQEHSPTNSPVAAQLNRLVAEREALVRQRAVQSEFQNTASVAKLDGLIGAKDAEIQKAQDAIKQSTPNELRDMLLLDLDLHGPSLVNPRPILTVAYGLSPGSTSFSQQDDLIKRITSYREQLANMASEAKTPPEVLTRAREHNDQIKQIQEELMSGRRARAQQHAVTLWSSLLE